MTAPTTSKTDKAEILNIFQRIGSKDQTVVKDCIDAYGNAIWELAKKATNSTEEAEAATREIFIDIWQYAERANQSQFAENVLITLITRRRLDKYLT